MTREELNRRLEDNLKSSGMYRQMENAGKLMPALSGGADSTFLLLFLADRFPRKKITALHFNHQIRGEEADSDQRFCAALCRRLGVGFVTESADVPALAQGNGDSTETAARKARYDFFEKQLAESGENSYVLTAHTADDQLETVLFHLLRGSGTHGMRGIPEQRDGFLRPLLSLNGEDIRSALRASGQPFVTDSTNADDTYTRNYLRHRVVPLLRRVVPHPEEAACRLAELCREDDDCLWEMARESLKPSMTDGSLPAECLNRAPRAVASRMLLLMHGKQCPGAPAVSKEQTDRMLALARERKTPAELSLPGGATFCYSADRVWFRPWTPVVSVGETEWIPGGEAVVGPYRIKSERLSEAEAKKMTRFPDMTLQIDVRFVTMDDIRGRWTLRPYRAGDTCRLFGMTRQIRKMYTEKKVTSAVRSSRPILFRDDTVVWVPGYPPCDGFREGTIAFRLTMEKTEE